jgi:hypothetical protein
MEQFFRRRDVQRTDIRICSASLRLCVKVLAVSLSLSAADFNVATYGAAGNGRTFDTAAIQKTIDAASAAGGGIVYFPTGRFLSGTITLKSDVTLRLSSGAVLLGSTRMEDYQPKHLIYAQKVHNVAIEGPGAIDGQGDAFFDNNMQPLPRPSPLIEIEDSNGIRFQGFNIRKAPGWTVHTKNCNNVLIRGISLLNNLRAINTDGLDIDSSRNVVIADSHIEAGDDAIVLKTTGRGAGPTENVTVNNCTLVSAASALKLGTESFGDFRHCAFANCVIRNSRTGIALLAKDGGSMTDISFRNIEIATLPKWGKGVEWPIVVDIDKRTAASRLSHIRDVAFTDITVNTKGRILAEGAPGSLIEKLSFHGLTLHIGGYEQIDRVKKLSGAGSKTDPQGMPDYGNAPAALIFGYVKDLTLEGVHISWPETPNAPARAAIFGDWLEGAMLGGAQSGHSIQIQNSKDVRQ